SRVNLGNANWLRGVVFFSILRFVGQPNVAELRCEDDLGSCLVIDGNSDEHGTRRQSLGALSRFGRGIGPLETGHQYLVEHPLGAFFLGVLLQGALVKGGEDPDSAAGRDGSA